MEFSNDTLILSQNNYISTKNSYINDNFPIKNPIQKEKSRVNLKTAFHLDLSKMKFLDIEINSNKKKYKTINVVKPKNKTRKFNFEKGENSIIQTNKPINKTINVVKKKNKNRKFDFEKEEKDIQINDKPKFKKKIFTKVNFNDLQLKKHYRSSILIKDKTHNNIENKNDKLRKESTVKEGDSIYQKKINIKNQNCSCVCNIF